jgi:hypothetical protein
LSEVWLLNFLRWMTKDHNWPQLITMKLQMFTFFTLCDYAFRCVFELAAYRSANPNGKISLKPLFVERGMMGLMCLAPVISRDDSSASCELLLHGAIWKKNIRKLEVSWRF